MLDFPPRCQRAKLYPMRRLLLVLAAFASCAARPAPTPQTPDPQALRSFTDDTRTTLDALVAVDTSHGHETDALKPIADRLRASMPVELVESTPGRGNLVARYKG